MIVDIASRRRAEKVEEFRRLQSQEMVSVVVGGAHERISRIGPLSPMTPRI